MRFGCDEIGQCRIVQSTIPPILIEKIFACKHSIACQMKIKLQLNVKRVTVGKMFNKMKEYSIALRPAHRKGTVTQLEI